MTATEAQGGPAGAERLTGVCHIAAKRGEAMCGAAVDVDEPWCCDPPRAPACGRRRCQECERLAEEALG